MEETKQPFDVAFAATRSGNLFTTHTPVEAGFDRFSPALMDRHVRRYAEERLGIPFSQLMALGRLNPDDDSEPFNMAYLAIRGSGAVNGVSRLHGEVSRRLFQPLFPRWPQPEVPIGHVTNGVHVPTWDSEAADQIWTAAGGKDRWRGDLEELSGALDSGSRGGPLEDAHREPRPAHRLRAGNISRASSPGTGRLLKKSSWRRASSIPTR